MSHVDRFTDELILDTGDTDRTNAVQVVSPAVSVVGAERAAFHLASDQAGTYIIEGLVGGQWLKLAEGSYVADVLHVFAATVHIPPKLRLKYTPTVTAKVLLTIDVWPETTREYVVPANAPAWISSVSGIVATAFGAEASGGGTVVTLGGSSSPEGRVNAKANVPVQISITDATSKQSTALPIGNYIITSNLDVAFRVAANPTAVATDDPVWAYSYRRLVIETVSDKVAAIRLVASTGVVTLTLEG